MPARSGSFPLASRPPMRRLAALLWLLACLAAAPAGATLHLLTHYAESAGSRHDAPTTETSGGCDLCASWNALGSALPVQAPWVPVATHHPPVPCGPACRPATAPPPRWFHSRAPPRQD